MTALDCLKDVGSQIRLVGQVGLGQRLLHSLNLHQTQRPLVPCRTNIKMLHSSLSRTWRQFTCQYVAQCQKIYHTYIFTCFTKIIKMVVWPLTDCANYANYLQWQLVVAGGISLLIYGQHSLPEWNELKVQT